MTLEDLGIMVRIFSKSTDQPKEMALFTIYVVTKNRAVVLKKDWSRETCKCHGITNLEKRRYDIPRGKQGKRNSRVSIDEDCMCTVFNILR